MGVVCTAQGSTALVVEPRWAREATGGCWRWTALADVECRTGKKKRRCVQWEMGPLRWAHLAQPGATAHEIGMLLTVLGGSRMVFARRLTGWLRGCVQALRGRRVRANWMSMAHARVSDQTGWRAGYWARSPGANSLAAAPG